jgi:hypothetical protein
MIARPAGSDDDVAVDDVVAVVDVVVLVVDVVVAVVVVARAQAAPASVSVIARRERWGRIEAS